MKRLKLWTAYLALAIVTAVLIAYGVVISAYAWSLSYRPEPAIPGAGWVLRAIAVAVPAVIGTGLYRVWRTALICGSRERDEKK